ncbi:MAG: hypothetical protein QM820_38210 [Minicystis sp.]
MTRWVLAAAAMVLGAGCGVVEPAAYPEAPPWQAEESEPIDVVNTFALRTDSGTAVVLHVTSSEILGPDVSLERFVEGSGVSIRGRAFGRPVDLEAHDGVVQGIIDGRPVSLAVERHDSAIHFDGIVRAEPSSFAIGARAAQGTIARCSYELTRVELGYEGRRSCGGPSAHVWLRLPMALDSWGDEERAAVLAILLGGR